MTTIIQVLNVIIDNRDKIEAVPEPRARGIYFRYAGQRIWSVEPHDEDIVVRVYPNSDSIADIPLERIVKREQIERTPENARISEALSANVEYSNREWTSWEAKSTFRDLYKTVQERSFRVDTYFDEIVARAG